MKKIRILIASMAVLGLLVVPVASTQAQSTGIDDVVVVDDGVDQETALTPEETKEGATPAAPDTGIAPTDNRAFMSIAVFVGGAALGTALGFGAVALSKKRN